MFRFVFIMLVFLSTAAFAADDYKAALDLYHQKRLKEAYRILKPLVQEETEKGRASLLLGTMFYEKKKVKEAKKYFDQSEPKFLSKDTAYAYGSVYLENEEYEKAMIGLKYNFKAKGRELLLTRYKIGVCYFKLGQMARAEKALARVKPKDLPKPLRIERQKYLEAARGGGGDELLSNFINKESDVPTLSVVPNDEGGPILDVEPTPFEAAHHDLGLRIRPGFMLRQDTVQQINKAFGRDTEDNLVHRVGARAYVGSDPNSKFFSSLDLGLGLSGFSVKNEESQIFEISAASGEFLSLESQRNSEENLYLHANPLISAELASFLRAEAGLGLTQFAPRFKAADMWGQNEGLVRLKLDNGDLDGGLEFASQQASDAAVKAKASDTLVKADVNQRFGEYSLRGNLQSWQTNNPGFKAFTRDRMALTDSRFKYHVGAKSETKAGLAAGANLGDLSLRLSYELTSRDSDAPLERLSLVDDPETVAKQAAKRMLSLSLPIWDTVNVSVAGGTQDLAGYHYLSRDAKTGAITKIYTAHVSQSLLQSSLVIVLVDWIKIRFQYGVGSNTYANGVYGDPDFALHNPRKSETSLMNIEVSKSF